MVHDPEHLYIAGDDCSNGVSGRLCKQPLWRDPRCTGTECSMEYRLPHHPSGTRQRDVEWDLCLSDVRHELAPGWRSGAVRATCRCNVQRHEELAILGGLQNGSDQEWMEYKPGNPSRYMVGGSLLDRDSTYTGRNRRRSGGSLLRCSIPDHI